MGGPAPHGPPGAFHLPVVPRPYRLIGTGMQAVMWFWVFYRAKQDGPAILVSCCVPLGVRRGLLRAATPRDDDVRIYDSARTLRVSSGSGAGSMFIPVEPVL